ncbi:MAG: nonstructural protein [Microvirus sp.]|nr:MAG: nonstructural protein [Microvirus sp.]
MKHQVCAIWDSAIQKYGRPYIVPHTNLAIRDFGDEVNRETPDNNLFRHPSDYELWSLGLYDDETGDFTDQKPTCIARGKDHKRNAS